MSGAHGIVVRTQRGDRGAGDLYPWYASAEAVPESLAREAVRGDLPATSAAREERRACTWPVEHAGGETEAEAVLTAVRALLERGLEGTVRT